MGKVPMKVGCDMKVEMRMTCYLQSKLAQPHRDSCHRPLQFHIDTNTRGEEKVWRKLACKRALDSPLHEYFASLPSQTLSHT